MWLGGWLGGCLLLLSLSSSIIFFSLSGLSFFSNFPVSPPELPSFDLSLQDSLPPPFDLVLVVDFVPIHFLDQISMASAKTARSRATPVKENGAKFDDGISFFKSDQFDADSYVQTRCSLNDKVPSAISFYPFFFSLLHLSNPLSVGWRLLVIAIITSSLFPF